LRIFVLTNNVHILFQPEGSAQTNPSAAAPRGDGQRDKDKTIDETSEMSMPSSNTATERRSKKKADKGKRKEKTKTKSKFPVGPRENVEIPHPGSPVEGNSSAPGETTATPIPFPKSTTPILEQENASSCSHDLGVKVSFSSPST
jgi:hypothetical protein